MEFDAAMSELLSDSREVADKGALIGLLERFCQIACMDWYLFAIGQIDSLNAPGHQVFTNATEWMNVYDQEDLRKDDPVVKYITHNARAVRWDELIRMEEYASGSSLRVMKRATDFGLNAGFSIPCNSYGHMAVLSLANRDDSRSGTFDKIILFGTIFAKHLLDGTQKLGLADPTPVDPGSTLTPRETECLFWASDGKTAWEISVILKVSERTVVFHLSNATKKLGASTRQHAVSKAFMRGLLVPRF